MNADRETLIARLLTADAWEARDGVLAIGVNDDDGFRAVHDGDLFDALAAMRGATHAVDDASIFESTGLPCVECGKPHREFVVPSSLWNRIVRHDNRETDREYLCLACFFGHVEAALRGGPQSSTMSLTKETP